MKRIPHGNGVNQSLKSARKAVQKALKGLNQIAGRLMARGDYGTAQLLAGKGREVQQFIIEVDALRTRWKDVSSLAPPTTRQGATPLWGYYQPVLKALEQCGGDATLRELTPAVEKLMASRFLPGDRTPRSGGRERWQVMVRRTRRHLASEGWIENRPGARWRITESGRRAAEKGGTPPT